MKVREELENYRKNVMKIENIKEEIEELLENRNYLTSGGTDASGIVAKGFKQSSLELEIIKVNVKLDKKENDIRKLQYRLMKVDKLIALLNEKQRKIIIDFFLFNRSNRKIADDLCVKVEAIKKRKKRIIQKMQKLADER